MGQNSSNSRSYNAVLWPLAVLWLAAGIAANIHYAEVAWGLRVAAMLGWALVALLIVAYTTQGRVFVGFLTQVRGELRKVAWPTREETLRSTLMVMVMVVIASLMLWGLDAVLLWAFGLLTGQGGH